MKARSKTPLPSIRNIGSRSSIFLSTIILSPPKPSFTTISPGQQPRRRIRPISRYPPELRPPPELTSLHVLPPSLSNNPRQPYCTTLRD
ncbi:hypothetical protein IMZ48_29605 [Candidatus Bathyarchaeota archaeon]|nr:hypothetical protein [Candidatus Bathyarchaeota archaeon]